MSRLAVNDAPAALRSASDGRESHERAHRLHLVPAAAWMTPEAFAPGGGIEQRTEHLRRAHGARCLTMWRDSLTRYAAGRPLTSSVVEAHNRQTLDHWAMARAAALALADARYGVRHESAPAQQKASTPPQRPALTPLAAARQRVLRGRR